MTKGQDIQERLIQYAARIIKVSRKLRLTAEGQHIAGHYAEACSAESPSDFVHKLKIAVKELNESGVWLRITIASDLLPQKQLTLLLDESNQLQRILSASIKNARQNAAKR